MAFNAMKADTVDYADRGTDIKLSDGTSILVGASKAEPVESAKDWAKKIVDDGVVQFAEQYCRDLTLVGNATADSFGRPAHQWKYDGDKIGTYADKAVLTYTAGVKGTDLDKDVDDAGYTFKKDTDIKYNRNGGTDGTYTYAQVSAALKSTTKIGGNGVVLELYANDKDEITKIVAVVTYLGEVKSIVKDKASTKADERALTVEYKDLSTPQKTVSLKLTADDTTGFDDVYDAVKVGDKVLVTPKGDNSSSKTAVSVAIPETVTGKITRANNKDGYIIVDGTTYNYAKTGAQSYNAKDKTVTVYLDTNGYVLDATEQGSDGDSAVAVLKVYKTLNKDGQIVDIIKGVTSDGETVTWQYDNDPDPSENKVYTYTEKDGVYTLGNVNASVADGNTLNPGKVTIAKTDKSMTVGTGEGAKKAYFASDVKFIFVNDGKATVLDGVQKVNKKTVYVTLSQDESTDPYYITSVYVLGTTSASSTTSDDLVFVVGTDTPGSASVIVDGKEKKFNVYTAYINGEEVNDFYTSTKVETSGFYSVEKDNDSGAYVLDGNSYKIAEGKLAVVTADKEITVVDSILTVDSKDYDISQATIVDVSEKGEDIDSVSALRDVTKAKVMMIVNADDMTASYVYVLTYTVA